MTEVTYLTKDSSSHCVFEIITSVRAGNRLAGCPHIIPVSRQLTKKVRKALEAQSGT